MREELAAYAAGALEADERARVERALAADESLARELSECEEALALLAYAVEPEEPPPALRASILSQARARAGGRPARTFPRSLAWAAGLAAAIVALVCLGVWNAGLRRELERLRGGDLGSDLASAARMVELDGSGVPGASARVFVDPGGERGRLALRGLPPLPSARIYQLWFKRQGGQPESGGVFRVDPSGSALVEVNVPVPLDQLVACAVTEEEAPGRSSPTGPHLLDLRPR